MVVPVGLGVFIHLEHNNVATASVPSERGNYAVIASLLTNQIAQIHTAMFYNSFHEYNRHE